MKLPVDICIENAKERPWEPHKYESKEAQDKNLGMLINWISDYYLRHDTFSEYAHCKFYEKYNGLKRVVTTNE